VPTFFSKIAISGVDGKFQDGCLWKPNPSSEVYREVRDLNVNTGTHIDGLLSIGATSKKDRHSRKDDTDETLRKRSESEDFIYDRLVTSTPLDLAALSDPKSFERFRERVRDECKRPDIRNKIQAWATTLVELRQSRSKTLHWEYYADLRVPCALCSKKSDSLDRASLSMHLKESHASHVHMRTALAKQVLTERHSQS